MVSIRATWVPQRARGIGHQISDPEITKLPKQASRRENIFRDADDPVPLSLLEGDDARLRNFRALEAQALDRVREEYTPALYPSLSNSV